MHLDSIKKSYVADNERRELRKTNKSNEIKTSKIENFNFIRSYNVRIKSLKHKRTILTTTNRYTEVYITFYWQNVNFHIHMNTRRLIIRSLFRRRRRPREPLYVKRTTSRFYRSVCETVVAACSNMYETKYIYIYNIMRFHRPSL